LHAMGSPRRPPDGAVLEWAEEDPDEVLAVQPAEADRALKDLLRQERRFGSAVRGGTRYRGAPEELAKLLAGVPF
jgi:hypothetical protein